MTSIVFHAKGTYVVLVEEFVLLSDPLSPTHHTDPTHHVLLAGPDRGAEVDLVVGAVTGGAAVADAGLGAELLQHRRHAGVVCGAALGGRFTSSQSS